MIAAVFDCVIYVQAILSRKGPAFACLQLAEAELLTLYLSAEILDEVKRSLVQSSLRRKFTKITDESVSQFLGHLEKIAIITQNARWSSRCVAIRKMNRTSTLRLRHPPRLSSAAMRICST